MKNIYLFLIYIFMILFIIIDMIIYSIYIDMSVIIYELLKILIWLLIGYRINRYNYYLVNNALYPILE